MNNNLLIVGASTYALVAYEIALDMGCFGKIAFVDDAKKIGPNGVEVIATTKTMSDLACDYSNVIVAIGNPDIRLSLIHQISQNEDFQIATLISPKAYVSTSAKIMSGSIIEPMAVVHSDCLVSTGCIISAGAVINHASRCGDGVHLDCNSTVEGFCFVPAKTKLNAGTVYRTN